MVFGYIEACYRKEKVIYIPLKEEKDNISSYIAFKRMKFEN